MIQNYFNYEVGVINCSCCKNNVRNRLCTSMCFYLEENAGVWNYENIDREKGILKAVIYIKVENSEQLNFELEQNDGEIK